MKIFIIDAQYDFLNEKGSLCINRETCKGLANRIDWFAENIFALNHRNLLSRLKENWSSFNINVFCTLDTHVRDDNEFEKFPAHCIKHTPGWSSILNLGLNDEKIIWLEKHSYSLPRKILDRLSPDDEGYIFAGVCTHICVKEIVSQIYNNHKNSTGQLPKIFIFKDLIGDFDLEKQEAALKEMQELYGVQIIEKYFDKEPGLPSHIDKTSTI